MKKILYSKEKEENRMFEKQDIENMLKSYLCNKSKIDEILAKIEENNTLLNYNHTKYEISSEEAIRDMSFSTSNSEIPSGKTNKINNSTERIALNYEKNLKYKNEFDKVKLELDNQRYQEKLVLLKSSVERVNRILQCLDNEEKLVIKAYYMYEPKWNYVSNTYMAVYKEPRTVNQLKNIRDKAMDKMLSVINI